MLYALAVVLLIIASILFLPVYATVNYRYEGERHSFIVAIRVLKITIFKKDLLAERKAQVKKTEKKKPQKTEKPEKKKKKPLKERLKALISTKENIFKIFDALKRLLVFKKLFLTVKFGTSNAANTGMLTGALNIVVYNLFALIYNNFKVHNINVNITPQFKGEDNFVEFYSIVRVQSVHIMSIVFNIIKILEKVK